jgi:2-polyprenyl-3-methyl-5-hydroxy-6-metoxy-1,4-benzoquinol methylase
MAEPESATTVDQAEVHEGWPEDGLEEVDVCPVCRGHSRRRLYSDLTDDSYLCAPGRWTLFSCETCGSAYLDPRPDARTAHLAYRNYYDGATPPVAEVASRPLFAQAIRNGYLNARYGYRARPASRLGALLIPLLPRRRQRADEYVRHLRLPSSRPRLLDVGCGEGGFLADMKHLGWTVEGIDPSSDAVAVARSRGLVATREAFSDVVLGEESLDAVTFRLVLEHLGEPASALRACRNALKPGGVVWIATPSLGSEAHREFGRAWIHVQAPRHAVMYTSSSLKGLLESTGFEVVAVRPSRQAMWSFRMSSAIASGLPPFTHARPLSRRLALRARLVDVKALRRPELADVVVVVAQKR